jgi:hypothetical protein
MYYVVVAALMFAFPLLSMAGIAHVFQRHRNRLENVAMSSDLFAAVVLLDVCVVAAMRG